MDKFDIVIKVFSVAMTFCTAVLVPFVIKMKSNITKLKASKTEDEFSTAVCEIKDDILNFVNVSEITFKSYSNEQKSKGNATIGGSTKLNYVLDKIETDCIKKHIGYDKDYWTTYVNNLIETTKTVN